MHLNNNKRKNEDGGTHKGAAFKRGKKDLKDRKEDQMGAFGPNAWKSHKKGETQGQKGHGKKTNEKHMNSKKKHLSAIVTEAKANYQLYADKKIDKNEKQLLMQATYDLIKDNIPELARMKGMGKIIGSLIDRKNKKQLLHVQNCYSTPEEKLLLIKGNGYRLAIKIIQNSTPKTVQEYVDACLSNSKGLRALMHSFKSARALCAAYACGNAASKKKILTKLAVGNMPIQNPDATLSDIFSNCKGEVVEGCKTFVQSVLNEKTIQQDLIQDIMLLCIETHKVTGMDIEDFLKIASENILPLCRRITNCALAMWVVWLSTAQMRKHIMKSLKGKVLSLLQTYNGRMFMIALFESTDDTKALHKMVLKEFLDSLSAVAEQAEVRKLLEYLLLPRSTKFMHPKELEILQKGDEVRTSKKSNEARFDEIREYMREPILATLKENCSSWLMDNKLCLFIIAIVERFGAAFEADILEELADTLASADFAERLHDKAVRMVLESLVNADIVRHESNEETVLFINAFVPKIDKEQSSKMINESARIVSLLSDGVTKLQKAITFKWKKSWINSKEAQSAVKEWKNQKSNK